MRVTGRTSTEEKRVQPPPSPTGTTELRVDLPDMRGYGQLLDEVRRDLGAVHDQVESYCANADFGKIVEDLTDDYAQLLPHLKELLAENETVMRAYAVALDEQTVDYERTDETVADSFGGRGVHGGTGTNAAAFRPVSPSDALGTPYPTEGELPEVSFGFLFDKLAWALETFTGWDVRREVTDWIAGDVVDLSRQGSCWSIASSRIEACRANLAAGSSRIAASWEGLAAQQHAIGMILWDRALGSQAERFAELGVHLVDLAEDAVNTAQFVVDCIRLAIDLISSAWALQYIPVYGQAKFIAKCWDAYKTASKATAYLRMLLSTVRAVKSFVVLCIDQLTVSSLPPKPLGV